MIGTARCMEFMQRPGRLKAANNMIEKGIDALVICGGDGSLTGADKFRAEWPGLIEELVSSGIILRKIPAQVLLQSRLRPMQWLQYAQKRQERGRLLLRSASPLSKTQRRDRNQPCIDR